MTYFTFGRTCYRGSLPASRRRRTRLISSQEVISGEPVRLPPSYKEQRNFPGLFWLATTFKSVVYESLLELDRLWLADLAPLRSLSSSTRGLLFVEDPGFDHREHYVEPATSQTHHRSIMGSSGFRVRSRVSAPSVSVMNERRALGDDGNSPRSLTPKALPCNLPPQPSRVL